MGIYLERVETAKDGQLYEPCMKLKRYLVNLQDLRGSSETLHFPLFPHIYLAQGSKSHLQW